MSDVNQQKDKFNIQRLANFGDDGIEIVDSDVYHIVDLELKDLHGFVRETVSRTTLYPNKTTRGHAHKEADEEYCFKKGTGMLILQSENSNKIFRIEPETYQFVDKGTWHMVVNLSMNEDLEFETKYPGPSARPPIIKEVKEDKKTKK